MKEKASPAKTEDVSQKFQTIFDSTHVYQLDIDFPWGMDPLSK